MNELEIFSAALELPSLGERARYLDQACGDNRDLRLRIDELLRSHAHAGSFMGAPAQDRVPQATTDELPREGPGTVIGPYKLLQQIGEGGMGVVFMAEQSQPVQRKVAIKVIKPGMDTRQVIARFEAERQALAMMDHVNIARVLDAGTTGGEPAGVSPGRPYFVMELVHGIPITKYCDDNHLTPRERLELFVPVCQAIQHAHQNGIIHRDLKPSNVMITLYDGKPVPKVIDFGVAKATEQKLTERTLFTQYGAMVGTLEYMSPEQAEMSALGVDTRSDIYSLGVLLYELLTGNTPLSHKTMKEVAYAEILRMIKEEEPPKPSTRLSDSGEALASISANRHMEPAKLTKLVRGELDWIVMKCLEKDRNRRYETANGFAADVQRYLADEPVQACPPSVGYRLRKFVRRNKRPVLAVAVILLALVGGVVGTSWGMVRAELARRLAEEERDDKDKARQLAETNENLALKARDAEHLALTREAEQRQRAEENLKLATTVLDEIIIKDARQRLALYTKDQAKGLAANPERDKLERELLEKGLAFYEKLAQTNATDWAARRERAKAYSNVGFIHLHYRNFAESEKAYRQATDLMEKLADERPEDFDNRFYLADAYHWFYRTYLDSGRLQPAEKMTRHALALLDKLAADFPDRSVILQEHRANCQRNLGQLLAKNAKPQEAEQAFQRSIAIWSELATANPKAAGYRNALSYDHGLLGDVFHQTGQVSQAMDAWRKALLILEKVVAETNDPQTRWQMAGWQERLAGALAETGQPQETERIFRQALSVWETLVAETNAPDHRWHLAVTRELLGQFFKKTGRPREAEKLYRDALLVWVKLAPETNARDHRWHLACCQANLANLLHLAGQLQEAEEFYRSALSAWQRLVADFPTVADYRGHHGWSWHRLANLLETTGRHAEAQQACRQVLVEWDKMVELAPKLIGFQTIIAWTWITCPEAKCRNVGRALEILKACVKQAPTYSRSWNALGAAYCRSGDWKEAVEALEKSMELRKGGDSFDWFFMAMIRWKLGEKEAAAKWYTLGCRWMDEHHPRQGIPFGDDQYHFEHLLSIQREVAALLGLPVQPPASEGKADELEIANLILEADPSAAWAYQHRGNVYAHLDQWQRAASDYAKSVKLKPDQPVTWYRFALVRLAAPDTVGYRSICTSMLERFGNTDDPLTAYWVAWTCVLAADAVADWKVPLRCVQKAVADNPEDSRALHHHGAVLYRAGQYPEALQRLNEAEAAYRSNDQKLHAAAYNWLFLAMTYHRLGRVEEAKKWHDRAVQWIEEETQKKTKEPSAANAFPWNRRLTLRFLRRDAEELLKQK